MVESVGVLAGIGRFPRAMPQMAVMWVSVPNTYMATPKLLPVIKIKEEEIMQITYWKDNYFITDKVSISLFYLLLQEQRTTFL